MYDCAVTAELHVGLGYNRQQLVKSTANRRVEGWQDSRRFVNRLFHGPWHDPVGMHIKESECVRQNFEMKLNLTWEVKLNQPPKQ